MTDPSTGSGQAVWMPTPMFDDAPPPVSLALRPYQADAIAAIEEAEARGCRRQLLVMPTGTGKTVVFSTLASKRMPGRALVLAHRDELIQQAADKLRTVLPGQRIGVVKAETDQHYYPVVVASVQTLSRKARLSRVRGRFATVIVDEAHHAAADTYRAILAHVGAGEANGPLLLGVTATPDRGDGHGLDSVFSEVVYQVNLLDMIAQGYLADLRALRIEIEVNLDRIGTRMGDFDQAAMTRTLEAAETAHWTAEAVATHAADRRILVFAQSVSLAHDTASELTNRGIPAAAVDGAMPLDQRRDILARLADGRLQAVANFGVLTEGFDCPAIDCIAMARPTKVRALYAQCVGRGMRPYPGKQDCLILDVVGVTERHELQTAASLTGVEQFEGTATSAGDREATEGASLVETMRQLGGMFKDPVTGRMVAVPVELFANQRTAWVPGAGGAWVLPAGADLIELVPLDGRWAVTVRGPDGNRLVTDGLDLGYAQGVAEDEARRLGAHHLIDRSAPWRGQEPTPKQIWKLRSLGIRLADIAVNGVVTRGAASDAITAALARQQGRVA